MATYYTKYYYQTVRNGKTYRLNILQRDVMPSSTVQIMNLVDLRFGTSGSVDIDETIIKTELSFVLVDCPDVQYGTYEKGANWQEFYTQDSTLYKVQLLESGTVRWTGYITPDSWSEELRYHGTVTIKARDCIGHLQDFDFDWEAETISLREIVTKCNALCDINIQLGNKLTDYGVRYTNYYGSEIFTYLYNVRFYREAFEDKSWYDVLESVLDSLALTLRYFDNNVFGITSLGAIRTDTFAGSVTRRNSYFALVNNSGSHSLAPLYKHIKEKISYDFFDSSKRNIEKSEFTAQSGYTSPLTSAYGYMQYRELTADDVLLIRFDLTDSSYAQTFVKIPESTKFTIDLSVMGGSFYKNLPYDVLPATLSFTPGAITARLSVIWIGDNYTTKYYQSAAEWGSSTKIIELTSESSDVATYSNFTLTGTTPDNKGKLYIRFYCASGVSPDGDRRFTSVNAIGVSYNLDSKTTKHEQTTVNTDLANVRLDRTCEVGQYVGKPSAGLCVKNAMLAGSSTSYYSIDGINKYGDEGIRYPLMWTWTHKQRLCFHWNNASMIEGELYDRTYKNPRFSDIYLYPFSTGLKRFHLVSGQINVLTGRVESAVLREFFDFDALWQEPKMKYYQFYILGADSATGYDEIVISHTSDGWSLSSGIGVQDFPLTVHCRLSNAMGWRQPRTDMSLYRSSSVVRTETVLDAGSIQESSDFDIILNYSDFDAQDPKIYIQALWLDGDEAGTRWEEAPTYDGYIKLSLY